MSRIGRPPIGLAALTVVTLVSLSACDFGAFLSTPLRSTSQNASSGRVSTILSSWKREVVVNAKGLAPNSAFALTANGVPVADLSTDANGKIDQTLSVDDHSSELDVAKNGDQTLGIEIEGVPAGSYGVFVDGVQRGTIDASTGSGSIEFATNPDAGQVALDFDPVGAAIEIRMGGELVFSGTSDAHIEGLDADEAEDGSIDPATGDSGSEDPVDSTELSNPLAV
jgi:hypothetical protein